jgi:hypothetical protein
MLAGFLMARSVRKGAPLAQAPGKDAPRSNAAAVVTDVSSSPGQDGVPSARQARRIALKLSAAPPGARLYLDDRPLAANPFFDSVSLDGAEHSVRAEARGYVTERRVIAFEQDVEVAFKLGPARVGPRSQVAAHQGALPPDPPAMVQVDCDPPYVMDEMGIRRLRPECLAKQ